MKWKVSFILGLMFCTSLSLKADFINQSVIKPFVPTVTEESKDAAYEAKSTALIGTWYGVDNPSEFTFSANGVLKGSVVLYIDDYDMDIMLSFSGTWSKKGNDLTMNFNKSSLTVKVATHHLDRYNALSSRKKAEVDKLVKMMNGPQMKSQLQASLPKSGTDIINYLSSDFLGFRNSWFVNKKAVAKLEKQAEE